MDDVFVEAPESTVDEEYVERAQAEMEEYLRLVEIGEIKTEPDCDFDYMGGCDWPNCKCDEVNCGT